MLAHAHIAYTVGQATIQKCGLVWVKLALQGNVNVICMTKKC